MWTVSLSNWGIKFAACPTSAAPGRCEPYRIEHYIQLDVFKRQHDILINFSGLTFGHYYWQKSQLGFTFGSFVNPFCI
jgi:hypothetical protein